MADTALGDYYEYLKTRSWKASLYRRLWLYPRLRALLPGRVLDVGCGIGDFLAFHGDAVGVDVNPSLVDHCVKRGLRAQLLLDSRYPFEDCSFDGVSLDNVLEHLEDPLSTVRESRRLLRQGGRFLVGVPGKRGYEADPDHKLHYELSDLDRVLTPEGFALVKAFEMPLPSFKDSFRQGCLYALFEKR
jgi:SAM-dependent methyltransferase